MHGRETRGISYGACTRNSEAIIGTRFISTRVFTRIPAVPKHSAFGVSPQIAPCIFANCTRPVIYRGWRAIGTSKNENHASNLSNFHPPKFSTSIDRDADERCPSSQFPFTIRFHSRFIRFHCSFRWTIREEIRRTSFRFVTLHFE